MEIRTSGHPHLSAPEEARQALWSDPMLRLTRAADAELGHLLIGQPGGRTPPAFVIGFRPGVPPQILGASIESSLPRTSTFKTSIPWPWAHDKDTEGPTLEEELALELGSRLQSSWATAVP